MQSEESERQRDYFEGFFVDVIIFLLVVAIAFLYIAVK